MIGLFFGSFNPIHIGHLALANYFIDNTDIKEIWFVISPQNPLKKKNSLIHHRFRLEMVNLAIGDFIRFKTCDIEFNLPQPSYTINTLQHLKEKYPKKQFSLILGADNLATFHKWKNYEEILKRHRLFVYPRPGYDPGPLVIHQNVTLTDSPIIEISSSYIRDAIKSGKTPKFFVHPEVWKYIDEMNFYKKR